MLYTLFSKALHSTYLLAAEQSALFDCGEGCATRLGPRIFAVERIFLSHGHIDHVAGLPSFLALRKLTKGANDKPLEICYPAGSRRIEEWLDFSLRTVGKLGYACCIRPLQPNQRVEIPLPANAREKRFVEAFPVRHAAHEPCYGYRVLALRKRLKAEFRGLPADYYRGLSMAQRADITEETTNVLMVYTGDSMPLLIGEGSPAYEAEIAFMDATFLCAADRDFPTHASLEEVALVCRETRVRCAYAIHLSIRYSMEEIRRKLDGLKPVFANLHAVPYDEVTILNHAAPRAQIQTHALCQ